MWELDNKEGWATKNWCFWVVVLEKTLESPLNCKEIKLVNLKGNQPPMFIGRTDAEAEAPIFWPSDTKTWLIGKDPDAGKDWRQKEKRAAEDKMVRWHHWVNGHQFSSIAQSCLPLCDPMDCSTPGFPVHHQLPELTQTHVHWIRDSIQWSHPFSSPSPPTFNLSQHHGLFQWVSPLHQVVKVLEFQLQHQFFQWTPRTDPLGWTGWISLQSKGHSRLFSNTTVQKHQFSGTQLSLKSNSHIHTWPVEKP